MQQTEKININDATSRLVLNVKLVGLAEFKARVWLGTQLIKLGVWIMGCGLKVEQ